MTVVRSGLILRLLILTIFLTAPLPLAARDAAAVKAAEAEAALEDFNAVMRGIYGETRAALEAAERPLIIVGTDSMILLTTDGTEERTYNPELYHTLKTFDHVVLGLIGALLPANENMTEDLAAIRQGIDAVRPHVDDVGLTPVQQERQRVILDTAAGFIDRALATGAADPAAVTELLKTLQPLLLENARDAAHAQLDGLHAAATAWKRAMAPEDWSRLRVLVPGPRMPRVQNLQAAYFLRLLGEQAEGGRVIYTESTYDTEAVLDHLGVILMDRALSQAVFGNSFRMDMDLLGNIAGDYLDRLLP